MKPAELRRVVLARDRECLLASFSKSHVCRDRWGDRHRSTELDKLTLEHVREHPGGQRRDDPGWCVAMCHRSNELHEGSSTEARAMLNVYLLGVRRQAAA